jgi:hypothetical protein
MFVLISMAIVFLYWMRQNLHNKIDEAGELMEAVRDDADYRSIRKAVPQDYDQPDKAIEEYNSFGRQDDQMIWSKLVELLLSSEPHQISDYAKTVLPTWVKLYFEWYRDQPVDSNYLVVKDLNYLDAAVYAAAQMNRLLKLDIEESSMVGRSLGLDWKLPKMPNTVKTIDTWDDREAAESIVFGSSEFLQSVILATARRNDALSASMFGPIWHSIFQPTQLLLQLLRSELDQSTLTPGRFAAVHIRTGGNLDDALLLKGKRAIRCGQWALKQAHQDFGDLYVISNNQGFNDHIRTEGIDMLLAPNGLERIVVSESNAHQARVHQGTTNGIHDIWWIDLYIAMVARCMVYGEGDFGPIVSKISNTDCQVRHEETNFGTAPLCPPGLLSD